MHSHFVDLKRSFCLVPKKLEDSERNIDYLGSLTSGTLWKGIINEPRVVILSEAGSGKTEETLQMAYKLGQDQSASFFVRLENIAEQLNPFEIGDWDTLQQWLQSTEQGWFFLDSVDEARLSDPRDFERAIKIFSDKIKSGLDRSHIFITSRISGWRSTTDLNSCNLRFPLVRGVKTVNPNDGFKIYSLQNLTEEQIRIYVEHKSIIECEKFLEEIHQPDAKAFITRPQDLDELIVYWNNNQSIGTKLQLVEHSINHRLSERDQNRADLQSIPEDRIKEGIAKVAVAMTLMQSYNIQVPDGGSHSQGIDTRVVLPDWDDRERSILLSRPIFDQALYGSVRFHHRSVREFLAANYFAGSLENGSPRMRIENLFFKQQYNVPVVVPTMRHLLPWIVLWDDKIRDRVINVAPEILLEGGDVCVLPQPVRSKLLSIICSKIDTGHSQWHFQNWNNLQKLGRSDIGDEILAQLKRYEHNPIIKSLLLDMISHGSILKGLDLAISIYKSEKSDVYVARSALRVVKQIGTNSDKELLLFDLLNANKPYDRSIVFELLTDLEPNTKNTEWLLKTLADTRSEKMYSFDGLSYLIENFAQGLSSATKRFLLTGMLRLLIKEPFVQADYCKISKNHQWLLSVTVKLCEKSIIAKDSIVFQSEFFDVISQLNVHGMHVEIPENNIHELISVWKELNYFLFWQSVQSKRTDSKEEDRLWTYWQVYPYDQIWSFTKEDFDWAITQIPLQDNQDDKLILLTLAFQLYRENNRPTMWRLALKNVASKNAVLHEMLQSLLHPPKMSEEQIERQKRHRNFLKQQEKSQKIREASRDTFIGTIKHNPQQLLNPDDTCEQINQYQQFIYQELARARHEKTEPVKSDWQILLEDFGGDVAKTYRDGAMKFWRHYSPVQTIGRNGGQQLPTSFYFGLSGLKMESDNSSDWVFTLSSQEITQACQYAFMGYGKFPSWFSSLYHASPDIVKDLMVQNISQNSDTPTDSDSIISKIFHSDQWLWNELSPFVFELLNYSPLAGDTLTYSLKIIEGSPCITDQELASLAALNCEKSNQQHELPQWIATWIGTDPHVATQYLANSLGEMDRDKAQRLAMQVMVEITGVRGPLGPVRSAFKTEKYLPKLILLMFDYINIDDDIDRSNTGGYSPGLRDHAQDARDRLIPILKNISGKDAFLALLELSVSHPSLKYRSLLKEDAHQRASIDSNLSPFNAREFTDYIGHLEKIPANGRELYELALQRLYEYRSDLEDGDNSHARSLIGMNNEEPVRNIIAGWCRDRSSGRYMIAPEEELADDRRIDLRFHGYGFDAPVPVELKLADKWSGTKLHERLENQLCRDYLRDVRSKHGIFLLLNRREDHTWSYKRQPLRFPQLLESLRHHWKTLSVQFSDIDDIEIIGIDLTKRFRRP